MKKINYKYRIIASIPLFYLMVACGGELPIQDMQQAKSAIGRAENLKAGEYAPDEMKEAKESLFKAHDKASEEQATDAKRLANYASSKAYDALEKSLPKLAAKARDEATEAIDRADEAYATGLASAQFDKAVALRKDGDQYNERGDQVLSEFLLESNEDKKGRLRQASFDHYEKAYNQYVESKKSAEEARSVAISSKSELRQSARYVEEDLNTAETYLGGPTDNTQKERANLSSAYQDIDRDELKKANEKIQTSRTNARTLLANSIQNYSRERLQTATEVVEDGNARFEKIPPEVVETDPEMKKSYNSARENLGAANEALASAGNLYSQEKYEDSIKQSEEAIRLGNITLEETAGMTPEAIKKREMAMMEAEEARKKSLASNSGKKGKELKEGWSKYKVKKTQPEDCLWRIAKRKEFYGNAKLWPRIYKANKSKIRNKNLIYPNQVLYIPPKKGAIGSPYKTAKEMTQEESSPQSTPQDRLNLPDEKKESTESDKKDLEEMDKSGDYDSNLQPQPSGSSVNGPEEDTDRKTGNEEELLEERDEEEDSEEEKDLEKIDREEDL